MEGSVLSFLKAEWKVSNTGSAHWASSNTSDCLIEVTAWAGLTVCSFMITFLFQGPDVSDWRGELLQAISFVFAKERDTLLAELRSHVLSHPTEDLSDMQKLEQKIRNQVWTQKRVVLFSLHLQNKNFEQWKFHFVLAVFELGIVKKKFLGNFIFVNQDVSTYKMKTTDNSKWFIYIHGKTLFRYTDTSADGLLVPSTQYFSTDIVYKDIFINEIYNS